MTRRWRFLLIGLFVAATPLVVCIAVHRSPSSLPKDRIENLKTGMSKAEAEEVIGMPPGDYTTRRFHSTYKSEENALAWWTDEAILDLRFDNHEHLYQVNTVLPNPPADWWERFRRFVGL
jgi:hypothetical protein